MGADGGAPNDDTLAPEQAATSAAPVVVRAGGKDDYRELTPIDPQHYVVGKEIARGGMGRILTARDRRLGRPVAIKELLVTSGDLRARFEREARITAKLQHPAIVNILEAGAWPTGEPFYVMKLVTGESLDKVIADRATLEARLALLPNVIATVDALAYAHANRVIHRDLKPANVLCGEFGETVVIDWGLAKDLADTSSEAPSVGPYRSATAAPGETVAGSVMGTPAYMPAEQARGDAVDERADVYALGAMLYHMLAGTPPYTGETTDMILDAVIAGPPPPLAARVPGVPPDLVTIVNKAMAHAAADRYPTARGLADDLKKFQTGQLVGAHHYSSWQLVRRWVRRHRIPVAVATIAAILLAAVGGLSLRRIFQEQARTKQQRLAAEQSRGEAEELMSFMLVDLRDKLKPLGRLDLLADVATKAVTYYERQGETGAPAEQRKRGIALKNVGDVFFFQGKLPEAGEAYRAARGIFRQLVERDATNVEWQRDLASSHDKVGDVLQEQGELAGALASYRAGLAIMERLVAEDPESSAHTRDLSVSHNRIGDVLVAQGDNAGALRAYRASLAIRKDLVAKDPSNTKWRRDLSVSYGNVGRILLAEGESAKALEAFDASLALDEALVASEPTNAGWLRDLAGSYQRVGNVLLAQGHADAALVKYRSALAITEKLAAQDPTNADAQRNVSISHAKIGNALLARDDLAGALASYRSSLRIAEEIAARDRTNTRWQRSVATGHVKVGEVLSKQGDHQGAQESFLFALAIMEQLAAKDPGNAEWQLEVATLHRMIGDLLIARNERAPALDHYQRGLAILERLLAKDAANGAWQREAALVKERIDSCCR